MTGAGAEALAGAIGEADAAALTAELVRRPSRSGVEPEEPLAALLAGRLAAAGLDVELRFVEPGRPNLVATLAGAGHGPTLMLNGHLDTMTLAMDQVGQPALRQSGGSIVGHGARNMKGGVAALTLAAEALARAGAVRRGRLVVAAVMGHLQGGRGTRSLVADGLVPDMAVFPEPTGLGVRTVQQGSLNLRVRIVGRSAPTGTPELFAALGAASSTPVDARAVAQDAADALAGARLARGADPDMPALPQVQVRGLAAGYGPEMVPTVFVPDHALVEATVFCGRGAQPATLLEEVETALAPVRARHAGARLEVAPAGHFRPALDVPADAPVVGAVARAHAAVTGRRPEVGAVPPTCYFGCDAQILAEHGSTAISYGPGEHAYRWDRRGVVEVAAVATCARALALAAADLLGTDDPPSTWA